MNIDLNQLSRIAQEGFAAQDAHDNAMQMARYTHVQSQTATNTGDIAHTFSLSRAFRLVFVRCHFVGGTGSATFSVNIDHHSGAAYDTRLFALPAAGTGSDVAFIVDGQANNMPSPWTFQDGDAVRVDWTNPDTGNMAWGLEIGLASAWGPRLTVPVT